VNFGAQEFGKDFLGFQGSENKKIQEEFEVQLTYEFFLKSSRLFLDFWNEDEWYLSEF
jgi:hypothetical protein